MKKLYLLLLCFPLLMGAGPLSSGPLSGGGTDGNTVIAHTITDGDLTHSPDGNSVFDSLALKANAANPAFTGQINFIKGADFAGATVNLATATGNVLDITTDTTAITSFGTVQAGAVFFLRFTSIRDIVYNVTSMILPGARNITTAVGDRAIVVSLGTGNWYVIYIKGDGRVLGDLTVATVSSTRNLTINETTGQTIPVTGAYVASLPPALVGRKAKLIATTANIFSVDVQTGTDVIYLNGTALIAGNKATSDGTIRATISCECAVSGVYECTASQGLFIEGGA